MEIVEIWKENGMYAARVPSLHVNTQAKTLKELKKNIKEAIDVAVEGIIAIKASKLTQKQISAA